MPDVGITCPSCGWPPRQTVAGSARNLGLAGETQLASMTSSGYVSPMTNATKRKVTLYLDEDVLRAARVRAARTDKRDSEVVEDALRSYLGFEAVERVWARSTLSEDEAMRLAVAETQAARAVRRAARGS